MKYEVALEMVKNVKTGNGEFRFGRCGITAKQVERMVRENVIKPVPRHYLVVKTNQWVDEMWYKLV